MLRVHDSAACMHDLMSRIDHLVTRTSSELSKETRVITQRHYCLGNSLSVVFSSRIAMYFLQILGKIGKVGESCLDFKEDINLALMKMFVT